MNYNSDDLDTMGFIRKDEILKEVTQEQIFSLVFGFEPQEFFYVTSPFREDTSPGCWFEYFDDGILRFKDFGNPNRYGRVRMRNIDCFDAIQVKFKLPNFYETLRYIKSQLIDNQDYIANTYKNKIQHHEGQKKRKGISNVKIFVSTREWQLRDERFWSRYEISKANLQEDRVFPIAKYKLKNTKKGDFSFEPRDATYVYTNFQYSKKKIYRPYQNTSKKRFITNCDNNDIGDLDKLIIGGRQLIISKSYKDCRVLRNQGLNSVWFQNEGQTPDPHILKTLVERFDEVVVWYDNDTTGIEAAQKVSGKINKVLGYNKSRYIYLPENLLAMKIKDPSDLIHKRDKQNLHSFLKHSKLI